MCDHFMKNLMGASYFPSPRYKSQSMMSITARSVTKKSIIFIALVRLSPKNLHNSKTYSWIKSMKANYTTKTMPVFWDMPKVSRINYLWDCSPKKKLLNSAQIFGTLLRPSQIVWQRLLIWWIMATTLETKGYSLSKIYTKKPYINVLWKASNIRISKFTWVTIAKRQSPMEAIPSAITTLNPIGKTSLNSEIGMHFARCSNQSKSSVSKALKLSAFFDYFNKLLFFWFSLINYIPI